MKIVIAPDSFKDCLPAAEVARLIEEAIEAHVALLREIGDPVPQPSTEVLIVEVS